MSRGPDGPHAGQAPRAQGQVPTSSLTPPCSVPSPRVPRRACACSGRAVVAPLHARRRRRVGRSAALAQVQGLGGHERGRRVAAVGPPTAADLRHPSRWL